MINKYACSRIVPQIINTKGPQSTQSVPSKRRVFFSTVEIHHHKLILGDHPAVSDGVPLTLDWHVEYTESIDLETHEERCRRGKGFMFIGPSERERLARTNGASEQCLVKTQSELFIIQRSRKMSQLDQPWGLWESSRMTHTNSADYQRNSVLLNL